MRSPRPVMAMAAVAMALALIGGCGGTPPRGVSPAATGTRIGLMLGGASLSTAERAALARDLGVDVVRPWDVDLLDVDRSIKDVLAFESAGFDIVMTVRNGGRGGPPPTPATPPSDIEAYKNALAGVLDRCAPDLLVVENEENSSLFYSGTPADYAVELEAACEVAHARGIDCTNGGMVSGLVAALVWDDYVARGQQSQAEDFLARAATDEQKRAMETPEGRQRAQDQILKGRELLAAYRSAGIDYVNFHWYVADTEALGEAVAFLRRATGLEPLTNEIGQHNTSPQTVRALLEKVRELRLPYAVWYSLDRGLGAEGSKALQEDDGTLRPTGVAFRESMSQAPPYDGL